MGARRRQKTKANKKEIKAYVREKENALVIKILPIPNNILLVMQEKCVGAWYPPALWRNRTKEDNQTTMLTKEFVSKPIMLRMKTITIL